jgi:hypothetical protein
MERKRAAGKKKSGEKIDGLDEGATGDGDFGDFGVCA